MSQCVMMIDRTLTTLSLMQRQAEFRSLSIGRKMLLCDQTKTTLDLVYVHRYIHTISAYISTEKRLSKYLANGVQIKKYDMCDVTFREGCDEMLNNRTLA